MIYTHIFLVILVTVVLIIFAEYQRLRKISWILFIGCFTYILLMIEPENVQSATGENDEIAIVDLVSNALNANQNTELDTVIKNITIEPENANILFSDDSEGVDVLKNLDITSLVIATNIIEKTPIDASRLFLNDINELYCFTVVDNTLKDNKIIHNWNRYEQDYFKSIIRVGESPNWRCWSRITIRPEMIGDWQVIVTDTVGNPLDSIEFSIIPTSE